MDELRKPNVQEIWWAFNNQPENNFFTNQEQGTSAFLLGFLQECHPCPDSVFRNDFILVREAFLVYHNIDPVSFEPLFGLPHIYDQIIQILDEFKGIRLFRALKNRFGGPDLTIYLKDFISFLLEKSFQIPEHFNAFPDMTPPILSKAAISKAAPITFEQKAHEEFVKQDESTPKKRRDRPETLRKMAARAYAEAFWKREETEGRSLTSPTDLARSKAMIDFITLFNQAAGIEPRGEKEDKKTWVDPEWFSDLHPNKTQQPGPKPKMVYTKAQ